VAVGSALLAETLSIGEKRVMGRPRQYGCVWQSSAALAHQYRASPLRQGAGQGREYPNGTLAGFKGPRRIVDYSAHGVELTEIPTTRRVTLCSPSSRRGLAIPARATPSPRGPSLTAAARAAAESRHVGTKKRSRGLTKKLTSMILC
jgi:hypothetical protein